MCQWLYLRLEKIYMLWKMDAVTQVSLFLGVTYTKKNYVAYPWHGAQFDLRSGKVMTPPECEDIISFDVSIEGEDVVITS